MKNQENKLIDAMMENDKADVELELLGGMAVEYAIVYANPGLVVKGDAISAGLSENMEKRIGIIQQITADLAKYYPDLAVSYTHLDVYKRQPLIWWSVCSVISVS